MTLYVYTTPDEYELPLCVADSVSELARKMDMKTKTAHEIFSRIRNGKYKSNKRYRIVEVDDDD